MSLTGMQVGVRGNWRTQQVKQEGFHIKRTLFRSEAELRTDFLGWVKIPEGDCAQTHPKYSLTLNIKDHKHSKRSILLCSTQGDHPLK